MTRSERRKIATEFVETINRHSQCVLCGKQPIEWHREEHKENARVSSLRAQGASIRRIEAEMRLCTPVCRSCHMRSDGRLTALRQNAPYQRGGVYVAARPCIICHRVFKPLRRGMCYTCSERHRNGGRNFKHLY